MKIDKEYCENIYQLQKELGTKLKTNCYFRKNYSRMKKIITISTFIFLVITTGTSTYDFEPVSPYMGAFLMKIKDAYISHSSWRLIYHYDLADFYDNVNLYKDSLIKLDEICNKLDEMNESAQCSALVRKHKSFLEDMNLDVEYLEIIQSEGKKKRTVNKRRKRDSPLGFVTTYGLKPIFGIMDEEDAEQIAAKINELAENQRVQHTILDHNLSIISKLVDTTNDTMFEFKQGMEEMSKFIEQTTQKLREMEDGFDLHLSFTYISSLATNIKIEYTKAINLIKRVIQNKLIGEFTELLTYKHLTKELEEIKQGFDDSKVRLLSDPLELQNSIIVTGAIAKRKLLIELQVPIVDRSVYTLQKIVRLPIKHNEKTIVFEIPHMNHLVQNETRLYIPMQPEDLAYCHEVSRKKLLCYPQRETHYSDETSCESNILFDSPQNMITSCSVRYAKDINWIIGLNNNQYYISPKTNLTIIERCIGQIPSKTIVDRPGIIKLDINCELYTDKIIIYPKYTRVRAGITNLPTANRTQGIKIRELRNIESKFKDLPPPPKIIFKNFNEEFAEIDDEISDNQKTLRDLETVQPLEQHVWRNTLLGSSLIFITIIIFCIIKKCFC